MAIRIRTVDGIRVALCAAEHPAELGDLYLDDRDHDALTEKYLREWQTSGLIPNAAAGWQTTYRGDPSGAPLFTSPSGVRQTTPSEILKSEKGREQIRKTEQGS